MIPFNDPRIADPIFHSAKRKEIEDLICIGTWKVVYQEEVSEDANVIGGRFVLVIKDAETNNPLYKARFVAQGHLNRDKGSIIHTSNTLQQSSVRVLLAIAALFGFRV